MALAIDSQESGGTAHKNLATPLTWTFTNTAGNLLVVGVVVTNHAGAGSPTITTVTYNGVAMTEALHSTWDSAQSYAAIYYLPTPATGAHSVSVTGTNSGTTNYDILGGAVSFSGANTVTPIGVTNSPGTSGAGADAHALAGSLTAASGNYLFGVGGDGSGLTTTADQTSTFALLGSANTGGDAIQGVHALSSGSAINLGFTWASADVWGMIAVEIKAGGGTANTSSVAGAASFTGAMPRRTNKRLVA